MADVFAILAEDHRRAEGLFERFEQTGDAEVALDLCDALTVHAMVEEELVYPVAAAKAGYQGLIQEGRQEHDEAKQLIDEIDAGVSGGQDVSALVRRLQKVVQHHVQEEESELFPKVRDKVPGLVHQMGEELLDRHAVLEQQLREARGLGMPARVVAGKPTTA